MFCPNYKIKEVFDGFNEMVEAFGGKALTEEEFKSSELRNQRTGLDFSAMEAAYRLYHRNGGNMLDKAPNGNDSVLFLTLLDHFKGNRRKAIIAKANVYSKEFFNWFGDWTGTGSPKVKFYGATMGKTTASKQNTNLVDFDDIVRDDIKKLAEKQDKTVRQLKMESGPEYVSLLKIAIETWRNDTSNNGKTLVVSNAALAKEPIFDNTPALPSKEEFIKRQVNRGEGNPSNAELYYNDLINKWMPKGFIIDDRFVSDIENVSKVTDENGEPLVVWHGNRTKEKIKEFKKDKIGSEHKKIIDGFWFITDRNLAKEEYAAQYEEFKHIGYGEVLPVYLNFKNPIIDKQKNLRTEDSPYGKMDIADERFLDFFDRIQLNSEQNDGFIVDVVDSDGSADPFYESIQRQLIAKNPNQIKHVENLGDWKIEDNNIYSKYKNIPFGYAHKLNLATTNSVFGINVALKLSSGMNVSSKEIISYLVDNQLLSDDNLKLAEILSRHDIPILYGELLNGKLAATITEKDGGSIIIIDPSKINTVSVEYLADTILHETVHALTVNALNRPKTDIESKFARQSRLVYNLFDKYVSEEERNDVYSGGYIMQNEKEFASIFITDDNARAYIYNKAKQIDKKGFIKNMLKKFVNSITLFLVNKNVFDTTTSVELLNQYRKSLLDHLNNTATVNYGSIKTEDLLDILFQSATQRSYLGDSLLKALINSEYEDRLLLINYNVVQSSNFEDIGRQLMTRRKIIQRSNIEKGEISKQSQLIESQVLMLISPNYADKFNALRGLAAQVGPQLHNDYTYLKTLPELTADEYMQIAHTNIGTYLKLAESAQEILQDSIQVGRIIQSLYSGPDTTTPEGLLLYNAFVQQQLVEIKRLIDTFSTISNLCGNCNIILKSLRTKSVKTLLLDIGKIVGDPDIETYVQKLERIDFDTSWFVKNMGAADATEDTAIRALAYLVNLADSKTNKEMQATAIKLANAFRGLNRKLLRHLYEKDSKGDKTGYLIRSKNYGVFYDEYNDEIVRINREISKKYGIKLADNNRLAPKEKEARKEWNKLRNDWLETHCDRRYVNRYYRALEKLSTEAVLRMSAINSQIYQINMLPGIINPKTGRPDYSKLNEEQWNELLSLITKKKLLRSELDEFGHLKCDAELEIAREIDSYYKELYPEGSAQMTQDVEAWRKDRQRVFEECGGQEEFDKYLRLEQNTFDYAKWSLWNTRNSKLSFIEASDGKPLVFKQIEREFGQAKPYYGEEEEKIAKEINKIISTFYGTNMIINDRAITKSMLNHIKNLITKQIKLRKQAMANNPDLEKLSKRYGAIFNSYIEFVTTERFRKLQAEAMDKATDEGSFDEMMFYDIMANYGTVIEDWATAEILGFRPFRWFTQMQAKDKDRWMTWTPGDAYNDVENSTSLKNKYFDESEGSSYIPLVKDHVTGKMLNRLYDNSREYARVRKTEGMESLYDDKLSKMYDTILQVMKENNEKMSNRVHVDNHLLPQIIGSLLMRMNSKNVEGNMFTRRFRIFKEWLLEKLGFRTKETMEDTEIGEEMENETSDNPIDFLRDINDIGLLKNMPDGRSMHIVPLRFLLRKNPKYISDDLLGILMLYTQMSSNYKNKVAIKDKCEMIVDMIANRKFLVSEPGSKSIEERDGDTTNTYQMASKFLEMNLYDIRRDRGKKYNASSNITWQASYALDLIRDYTTTNNLGMNPKVSIVGMLTSQWNHMINALTGNAYSFGDANFGGLETLTNVVTNLITSGSYIANDLSNDKQMVINRTYNVQGLMDKELTDSHLNRLEKAGKRHSIFGLMSGLDFLSKTSIANSILHSYRFVDGEWVTEDRIYSMSVSIPKDERKKWLKDKLRKYRSKEVRKNHNLYTSISVDKDGNFYIADEKKRLAYNDDIHHQVFSRILKFAERADGMATKTLKAAITQSVIGSFVLIHRQYLPLMIQERFTKEVYDYDMAMMKNGQTRSMLSFCKDLMTTSMFAGALMGGVGSYIMFQSIPVGSSLLTAVGAIAGAIYSAKNKDKSKTIKQVLNDFFNDDSSEFAALKSRYHKKIFRQVLLELLIYNLLISPFVNWLCGWADDDKDKWWLLFTALCLRLFQWESYTPYRFDDIFNNFKTVTAATGTLDYLQLSVGSVADTFFLMCKIALFYTLGLTEENKLDRKVKSGVYKDWNKNNRNIYNFIPIHNLYKQGFYAPIWRDFTEELPTIEAGGAVGPYKMRNYTENQIMKINE